MHLFGLRLILALIVGIAPALSAEAKDIAQDHSPRLNLMIDDGAAWSKTLTGPQWHDTAKGMSTWKEKNMPQYERTFRRR